MTASKSRNEPVDVLILGGGPAGLSALLWSADLGMSSLLLERAQPGGQLFRIHNPVTNYPGRATANGSEMAGQFLQSVDELSDRIRTVTNVVAFDARSITASTEGGETFTGRAAVIATGVSRRKLNVPGESELTGRGILLSGAGQKSETAGKRVAIIGGGDAALENALILSRFATRVFVVHRRDRFSARDGFVSRAARSKNVEFLFNSTVMSINGEDRVHSLTLRSVVDATTHELDVDLVLIRIGVKPNTEIFADQIELDGRGYIIVDALAVTNVKNIFAAGDVANPISPTISTAVGMASTAVKAIDSFIWRETRS